ncbi:MAG: DMT family transporter [Bacteroidetes bacterium]|nr:DMT family transporter [Bacteroidota bacterium]MBS1933369.1 DMT family transporter [Bacteroidota bacterium]
MQSRILLIVAALSLGAILPMQAAINSRLAKSINNPVYAAFISFAVGTVALFAYLMITRQLNLQALQPKQNPWWIWIGGLLGTFFVAGIVMLLPRLGVVLAFSLVIAGQMIFSILFDQFGWLGVAVREISPGKIVGVILLIAGVVLIRRF